MCETCRRTELERANKALILNGISSSSYNPQLLAASAIKPTLYIKRLRSASSKSRKPTLHIRRIGFTHSPHNIKLRTASFIMQCPDESRRIQKQNAEKALKLNIGF